VAFVTKAAIAQCVRTLAERGTLTLNLLAPTTVNARINP